MSCTIPMPSTPPTRPCNRRRSTGTRGSARVRSRSTKPGGDSTRNRAAPAACTDSTVAPNRDTAARPIATASMSSPGAKSSAAAGCGSTNSAPDAAMPINRQRCSPRSCRPGGGCRSKPRRQPHPRRVRHRVRHARLGRGFGVVAPSYRPEMVEQEGMLRGIAQRRAGRQQRGAVGIVEIEAERDAGGEIVARERDVVGR